VKIPHSEFTRWPTLLAAVTLTGTGLALDLADPSASPFAAACLALGAVAFGAFVYAEGARHRDWTDEERTRDPARHADPPGPAGHDPGPPG
jgi:hypothetical protein